MSATDYFLFPLAFLVSGLLAEWIRRVSTDRDRRFDVAPMRVRDGELARLTESLASALRRIEALERRNEAVVAELDRPEGTATTPNGDDADRTRGAAVVDLPPPEPTSEVWESATELATESEVSPSQWRSAMGRLGPAWQSGSRRGDPGRRTSPVERVEVTRSRDAEPEPTSSSASGRGVPLDDLFPPSLRELPGLREADSTDPEPEHRARAEPTDPRNPEERNGEFPRV